MHADEEEQLFPDIPEARFRDAFQVEKYRKITEEGDFDRFDNEIWWAEHYQLLLSHGYRLRYRFRPNWTPSWLGTDVIPYYCDDVLRSHVCHVNSNANPD